MVACAVPVVCVGLEFIRSGRAKTPPKIDPSDPYKMRETAGLDPSLIVLPESSQVGRGTRDPAGINAKYREPIEDIQKESGAEHVTLETVRQNIESVVQMSLQPYQEPADTEDRRALARRLRALKLVGVDTKSIQENPPNSGIFTAKAIFDVQSSHSNIDAEIKADFSDPHWHLSEIKFLEPPKPPSEPTKPPEPQVDPVEAARGAVQAFVKKESASGQSFNIKDPEQSKVWQTKLRVGQTILVKDLGGGRRQARADFLDLRQQHVFAVEFIVAERGSGPWEVAKASLVAVDDKPRASVLYQREEAALQAAQH